MRRRRGAGRPIAGASAHRRVPGPRRVAGEPWRGEAATALPPGAAPPPVSTVPLRAAPRILPPPPMRPRAQGPADRRLCRGGNRGSGSCMWRRAEAPRAGRPTRRVRPRRLAATVTGRRTPVEAQCAPLPRAAETTARSAPSRRATPSVSGRRGRRARHVPAVTYAGPACQAVDGRSRVRTPLGEPGRWDACRGRVVHNGHEAVSPAADRSTAKPRLAGAPHATYVGRERVVVSRIFAEPGPLPWPLIHVWI
jgi:hypothetical protein